jgi:hypothetical protein
MTIIEQLSAAQERIAELEASTKLAGEQAVAAEAKAAAAQDSSAAAIAEMKSASEKHTFELAEQVKKLEAEQAAHKATAEELAKTKAMLANPAFADAAAAGSKDPVTSGIAPVNDKMTRDQAEAEYRKIENSRERTEYRKKNWALLGIPEEK